MGVNEKELQDKTPVSFVLLDNHHLTEHGVRCFCEKSKQAVVITSNASHPAFRVDADSLHIIYQERPSLSAALEHLKKEYGCERLTVQSGGTINGLFLCEKLLDYVDIVVAPVLIGGKDTPTLIDGRSLLSNKELGQLASLELIDASVLQNSYLRLQYRVIRY